MGKLGAVAQGARDAQVTNLWMRGQGMRLLKVKLEQQRGGMLLRAQHNPSSMSTARLF